MGIGLRLKEILRERGITIKQFSKMSGIPLNTLYSITKRDSNRIDQVIFKQITESLNVTNAELLGIRHVRLTPLTPEEIKMYEEAEEILAECEAHKDDPSELRILQAYHKLNFSGQCEAVKRIEELTEIPRYRRQDTPEPPSVPTKDTDTTSPPDTPEKPPEGE